MEGTKILHYEIEKLLGSGGMGSVYKALDTNLNTYRALKFLHPGLAGLDYAKAHLLREARTQAKLFHPNIAALLELQKTDEHTFLVMEYVDGPSLDDYLKEYNPSIKERFNIILQVACALDVAHNQRILHRDIKPRNILVSSDGTVKVTDFGLAKVLGQTTLTMSGETKGTAPYMAPEAFRGEKIEAPADIWSLGVLTYEILEGSLPFKGPTFEAVAFQIINDPYPPLSKKVTDTLPGISEFIDLCLKKNVKDRLIASTEASLLLNGIAERAGYSYSVPMYRPALISRRIKVNVARVAVSALVLGLLAFLSFNMINPVTIPQYERLGGWNIKMAERSPSWNSSGDRIALLIESKPYIWMDPTDTDPNPFLEPIHIDTEILFEQIGWAPTDSLLSLTSNQGLYLFNLNSQDDSRLIPITNYPVEDASWSSDGKKLVYWYSMGGLDSTGALSQHEILGENGSIDPLAKPEIVKITGLEDQGNPLKLLDPVYILDNTHIAFRIDRSGAHLGIWIVPVSGGSAWEVIGGELCPHCLNWDSENRSLIFYSGENQELFSQKISKQGRRTGTALSININGSIASFDYHAPTGRITLTTSSLRHDIWSIPLNADTDSRTRVNTRFDREYSPTLSRDGRKLYYAAYGCLSSIRLIVFDTVTGIDMDLYDDAPTFSNENQPAPHPDGRYVVFIAEAEGKTVLYLYDSILPHFEQLTFDSEEECDPIWSPDGQYVYYVWHSTNPNQNDEIRRITFNTAGSGRLTPESSNEIIYSSTNLACPQPDASGRYLIFQEYLRGDYVICVMDLVSEETFELIQGRSPVLSPTGQDVYYYRDQSFYIIEEWSNKLGLTSIVEQSVYDLPPDLNLLFNRPFAAGNDILYAVLLEQEAGQLTVLSPNH